MAIILNEESINQFVKLTANISSDKFNVLKNAKSCDDIIEIDFEMGPSYYFKGQSVNHYRTDFGASVILRCDGDELIAVFDRCTINSKKEEKGIYPRFLFNACFLETQTVVDYSAEDED